MDNPNNTPHWWGHNELSGNLGAGLPFNPSVSPPPFAPHMLPPHMLPPHMLPPHMMPPHMLPPLMPPPYCNPHPTIPPPMFSPFWQPAPPISIYFQNQPQHSYQENNLSHVSVRTCEANSQKGDTKKDFSYDGDSASIKHPPPQEHDADDSVLQPSQTYLECDSDDLSSDFEQHPMVPIMPAEHKDSRPPKQFAAKAADKKSSTVVSEPPEMPPNPRRSGRTCTIVHERSLRGGKTGNDLGHSKKSVKVLVHDKDANTHTKVRDGSKGADWWEEDNLNEPCSSSKIRKREVGASKRSETSRKKNKKNKGREEHQEKGSHDDDSDDDLDADAWKKYCNQPSTSRKMVSGKKSDLNRKKNSKPPPRSTKRRNPIGKKTAQYELEDDSSEAADDPPNQAPQSVVGFEYLDRDMGDEVTIISSDTSEDDFGPCTKSSLDTCVEASAREDECAICLTSPMNFPIINEPCGHMACFTCIEQWRRSMLMKNINPPNCHVCRQPFRSPVFD